MNTYFTATLRLFYAVIYSGSRMSPRAGCWTGSACPTPGMWSRSGAWSTCVAWTSPGWAHLPRSALQFHIMQYYIHYIYMHTCCTVLLFYCCYLCYLNCISLCTCFLGCQTAVSVYLYLYACLSVCVFLFCLYNCKIYCTYNTITTTTTHILYYTILHYTADSTTRHG